jgi:spermidine synthase
VSAPSPPLAAARVDPDLRTRLPRARVAAPGSSRECSSRDGSARSRALIVSLGIVHAVPVESGVAELLADADRPGGWLLLVDRIRQSYVDLDDPTYLDFEYLRSMADIVDALAPGPIAVVHVGGGGCTFARYVAARRPGSSQVVLEPDTALVELVRARLPLPRGARIRVRPQSGRDGVRGMRDRSADVMVVDAYLGGRVPGELTTREFLADAARVLRPEGVLLANLTDGPPLSYTRRVAATARTVLPQVLLTGSGGVLGKRRYGNLVLAASRARLPLRAVRQAAASATFPTRVVAGAALDGLVGADVQPLTDAAPMRSPRPPEEGWRVEPD